ncbi:alpha-isopropylmalate synthase regulatory domain-containing protein, partial [Streptomyces sp. NPDC055051]
VESWQVSVARRRDGSERTEAAVRLRIDGVPLAATGSGNGPVNALDRALHQALDPFFPQLARLELVDYRVRVLTGDTGSGARARVLIGYHDGERRWGTVGVDGNTVTASWRALLDAVRYVLRDEDVAPDRSEAPLTIASAG